MKLKPGQVLYHCYPFYDEETGKVNSDVEEWVIRSIRRRRNSMTRWGFKKSVPNDSVYVNMIHKYNGVTWDVKKGDWYKSIPKWLRKQFHLSDQLPDGYFTTPLQALKYAEKELLKLDPNDIGTKAELRSVRTKLTLLRKKK